MSNTPLNPNALEAAVDAVIDASFGQELPEAPNDLAAAAVTAYLAVAQQVVNSMDELDALPPDSYVQGWDGFKHAKTHSGDWVLCVEHTRGSHEVTSIELPATVLYLP